VPLLWTGSREGTGTCSALGPAISRVAQEDGRSYMDAISIEDVSEACDRILRREACSGRDGKTG
jgi:hypothetical protein